MAYRLVIPFAFFCILVSLLVIFYVQTTSAQSPTTVPTFPPERIAPKGIQVEQLHKEYTEKNHRYRLTIEGDNLDEKPTGERAIFTWKTNCGRFYQGGSGPASRYLSHSNKTVVWGYDYPQEDCTEAEIQVIVRGYKGGDRQDEVTIKQKIFYPELQPEIVNQFYKGISPQNTPSLWQRINIFIGNLWHEFGRLLGLPPDDPTTTETPGGTTGVRG